MKNVYKELNEMLGGSPVIELKETEKAKDLKAYLLVKTAAPEGFAYLDSKSHPVITDRRIKALAAGVSSFEKLAPAVRLLRTHIPDLKVFAVGDDLTAVPDICTGFLADDPETALFTQHFLQEKEGLRLGRDDSGVLGAVIDLAKKDDYTQANVLVYLEGK